APGWARSCAWPIRSSAARTRAARRSRSTSGASRPRDGGGQDAPHEIQSQPVDHGVAMSKTNDPNQADSRQPPIRVAPDRLNGVIQALAYAAQEQYEACLELLHAHAEKDEFTELETAFTTFVEELAQAKRALKDALGRHEVANRELEDQLRMIELQQ